MNDKPKLKVKHKVEDIIRFIELNDLEKVTKIVECSRKILKKKNMDDNEPIYYSIKYKCNKIFKHILDNSEDVPYDVKYKIIKLFITILVRKTLHLHNSKRNRKNVQILRRSL
jgi:hypothetical protein